MALDLSWAVNHKRAVAQLLMRDQCDVIAATVTDDGFGGQVESWETPTEIAADQPCYYTETLNEDEQAMVNRRGLAVTGAIYVLPTIAIREGHRIVLTASDGQHSGTYSVQGLTAYTYEVTRTALVGKVG